jgi:photosystem II stability/assembly factor-like uncharacterized protein
MIRKSYSANDKHETEGIATKKILCFLSVFFIILSAGCSNPASEGNAGAQSSAAASGPGKTASFQQSSGPKDSNQKKQPASFVKIDMVTIHTGYAITKDFHVLKTSDGGVSWTDVLTENSLFSYSDEPALFALGDSTVSAAFYTASGIEVEKSADGGKNWTKSEIKMQTDDFNSGYGGSLYLNMVNPSDGFLLASTPPAAGLMAKALYRTSDAGCNWSLVDGITAEISGYTTGMAFSGANTGYITCTYHGQKEIAVYQTADGGKSWSDAAASSLPLPQKFVSLAYGKDYYVDAYPPAFFGENNKNSKMELYFCREDERQACLYRSDDGGTAWHLDGISNQLMKKYCFVDDKNGFGLDESGTLYASKDGGITWSPIS